jgi:hypothetical protein
LVAAQLSALSDDPFGPADEGAESGCCGVNLIVVRAMGKGAQFLNESVIPGSYHVQGVSRATRASVIIEEFRTTLFHENLPPMRANPAAGSLSREGRGPICQVEEVEGAIRTIALRRSSGGSVRRALLVAWLPVPQRRSPIIPTFTIDSLEIHAARGR